MEDRHPVPELVLFVPKHFLFGEAIIDGLPCAGSKTETRIVWRRHSLRQRADRRRPHQLMCCWFQARR